MAGALLQDHLTRVADGVHRVAHAVDQAGAIARLLAQDAAQILAHLIVILRVLDVLEDILQLAVDHQVRAAVLGALQSTDGRRDGRVGVRTGGGQHTGGKGGAVAAAVVCVDQQAHIQQLCLLVGELLIRAVGAEDVLCRALAGLGQVEEHTLFIVVAALHLVSVHHHGGHAGDQIDTLAQDVLQTQILGVLIIRVKAQHAALQLIHDIGRGGVHGVHEAFRQGAVLCQDLTEIVQLLPVGQTAEQQQPDHLFKHKAVIAVGLVHDLVDVHTAVDQLAGSGDHMAFLILFIAHNVADVGQAGQHTSAIRVAQAALDPQTLARLRIDVVVGNIFLTQSPHRVRVQRCHLRMCKIHKGNSPFILFIYFPAHPQ